MNFLDEMIDENLAPKYIEQGSEQWDAIRIGRFTASEIHRLMDGAKREMTAEELKARPKKGVGSSAKQTVDHSKLSDTAMTYVNEKAAEVLTARLRPSSYAFPLVYGKDTEPLAVEHFCSVSGLEHTPVGFFPYTDHAGGSPDGLLSDDSIIEIKCPFDSANQINYMMLTDHYDLRRNYKECYWQCQANLLFTGKKVCHFVTFDPRMVNDKHKMTWIQVPAVSSDHELIIQKIAMAVEEKLKLLKTLSV